MEIKLLDNEIDTLIGVLEFHIVMLEQDIIQSVKSPLIQDNFKSQIEKLTVILEKLNNVPIT